MGLSIIYFKGSQIEIFKKYALQSIKIVFILAKIVFILANSAGPDEMPHVAVFHQGLRCLPKYSFRGFQYTKGLYLMTMHNICMKCRWH